MSSTTLAEVGRELGVGLDLRLGKGEDASGGREKASILADAVEAVLGAMYLDGGVEPVRRLVLEQLSERIDQAAERPGDKDYKTRLQEVAAHDGFTPPVYALTESGPDHHKRFHATVAVGGERLGAGTGTSKKKPSRRRPGPHTSGVRHRMESAMMFELPEVETVRRELDRDLVGKKVKTVEAASMAVLKRYKNRKAFTGQLDDMKITGVGRRGLHLLIVLDGDSTLVVDLGSSGSLRRNANKDKVEDSTEVVITFTQHGQLRLVDPGGTAEMFVVDTGALADEIPELEDHGLDPVDEPVSWTEFGRALLQRNVKLKTLLLDDTFVVGIGNLYADEILYEAGLRFDRLSNSLSSQEIRRLHAPWSARFTTPSSTAGHRCPIVRSSTRSACLVTMPSTWRSSESTAI